MFKFSSRKCLGAIQYLGIEDFGTDNYHYYRYSYILLIADTLSVQETQSPVVGGTYKRYSTNPKSLEHWHLEELKNLDIHKPGNWLDELCDEDIKYLEQARDIYYAPKQQPENLNQLTTTYVHLDDYKLLGFEDLDHLAEESSGWNFCIVMDDTYKQC